VFLSPVLSYFLAIKPFVNVIKLFVYVIDSMGKKI
jgi:hypothetical protein